jgi:hypothetical protein
MQNRMTMAHDHHRTTVRRRQDGLAQIAALPLPSLTLGTLRTLGLGVVGVALLVAALVAAPFWLAFGGRTAGQARAGARTGPGAAVTDLSHLR